METTNELNLSQSFVFTDEKKEVVDKYIKHTVDGIVIDNEDELKNLLSQEEYTYVKFGVQKANAIMKEESLIPNHNQSCYVNVQQKTSGGGINRSEVFYWGIRRYNDKANTKRAADSLISNGKQFKSLEAIPSGILALIGLTPGVVGTIAGVLGIGVVVGNWVYDLGIQLRNKNNTYGTVIDINWVASVKVWKQTSSTK